MLKDINVRFFIVPDSADEPEGETTHDEFVERYAECPHGRIDVELHTVYNNGVRQLCITLNEV